MRRATWDSRPVSGRHGSSSAPRLRAARASSSVRASNAGLPSRCVTSPATASTPAASPTRFERSRQPARSRRARWLARSGLGIPAVDRGFEHLAGHAGRTGSQLCEALTWSTAGRRFGDQHRSGRRSSRSTGRRRGTAGGEEGPDRSRRTGRAGPFRRARPRARTREYIVPRPRRRSAVQVRLGSPHNAGRIRWIAPLFSPRASAFQSSPEPGRTHRVRMPRSRAPPRIRASPWYSRVRQLLAASRDAASSAGRQSSSAPPLAITWRQCDCWILSA